MTAVSDAITAADRTLDSIADELGIPSETLSEELSNPDALHWITVLRVADVLGVDIVDLLPMEVPA